MELDRSKRIKRLFQAASRLAEAERSEYLKETCVGDEALRREVQMLLDQPTSTKELLAAPALAGHQVTVRSNEASLVGRQLGVYRVEALVGTGGMGEVYRARDTRLGRDVAIKVLPHAFTSDPDRLARFEREARMLAALNHPNIGAIYGIEEGIPGSGLPICALVLELVDGETLAQRIARASIPVPDALRIGRQIAEALEIAHRKGIVHRDLKPANIKITPDGVVKVLDFGLAKVTSDDAPLSDASQSPTMTISGTSAGVIVGTAPYMSPEQARGKPVDKQTDIWAFGCILFEMLTGRTAFAGDTVSDTLAKVLEREPDWNALPTAVPERIRQLTRRCLYKDPKQRLHDIADARIEFDERLEPRRPTVKTLFQPPYRTRHFMIAAAMAAVLAIATYYLVTRAPRTGVAQTAALRATFHQLTALPGIEWFPSLSPDGKWAVYSGEAEGNRDIYLQSVTGQTAINLTRDSTADDDEPAFSPDGEQIAFRSSRDGGGIFVMGRTGEAVRRVTRAGFKPAWSPDGRQLVYAAEGVDVNPQNRAGRSELWIVGVNGGEPNRLVEGDALLPSWSPHAQRIAYMGRTDAHIDVWTVPAGGGAPIAVTQDPFVDWSPEWSADGKFLYFASDRSGSMNLWRVGIDEASGKTMGEPEPITTPAPFVAHPSVSGDGRSVAYSSVLVTQNLQALTLDPTTGGVRGEPIWLTSGSRRWSNPDQSPDRQWFVFYSRTQPEGDIYIAHPDGTGLRQVTSDAAIDRVPRWSPDGRWIAFNSNRNGKQEVWKIRPDGSDLQQVTDGADAGFPVWSPDGSRLRRSDGEPRQGTDPRSEPRRIRTAT